MRKIKILWGIIFILVLSNVLSGAYFYSQIDPQTDSTKQANKVGENGHVAKVGSASITETEFTQRLIKEYGEEVLDDMINRKVVFAEAKRLNADISEEEIDREIGHIRKDYSSEEEFQQALQGEVGITSEELREEIRFYLLVEELATKDIVITEEQIRNYFAKNADAFYEPTRFHLHRILVETEAEAQEVITEIKQGSSFEAVASERSTDMITSPDGGDMGVVTSDDFFLPYEIVRVAEQIPLNEISTPIESEEGFSVIKVTKRIEGGQQGLEEVRDKVRRELALREIDGVTNFMERLRENAEVEVYLEEK